MDLIAAVPDSGFGFGLLVAAFWFGFRHGIDWDHIAAITDITGSQDERRRAFLFGTLYALGHALVVLGLGTLAIIAGDHLPEGVDEAMTRVVGGTLLLLGVYVVVSLIRHGRDFRLRSRWMLVFAGVRRGTRWMRGRLRAGTGVAPGGRPDGSLELPRDRGTTDAVAAVATGTAAPGGEGTLEALEPDDLPPASWHHGHHGRPGHHHHARPEPEDVFPNYGRGTSFAVGMIHGVGAETPTQVLLFLAAAGAGGPVAGVAVLLAFIVGLLASNSVVTAGSALGFLRASANFGVYAAVAVLTAVFSLVIGTIFVLNRADLLPGLIG